VVLEEEEELVADPVVMATLMGGGRDSRGGAMGRGRRIG